MKRYFRFPQVRDAGPKRPLSTQIFSVVLVHSSNVAPRTILSMPHPKKTTKIQSARAGRDHSFVCETSVTQWSFVIEVARRKAILCCSSKTFWARPKCNRRTVETKSIREEDRIAFATIAGDWKQANTSVTVPWIVLGTSRPGHAKCKRYRTKF